jgi:hypothetical protein
MPTQAAKSLAVEGRARSTAYSGLRRRCHADEIAERPPVDKMMAVQAKG